MINNSRIHLAAFITMLCSFSVDSVKAASSPQLVPPPYNVIDRHSVNVMTGQVQMTHSDVVIGGDMGLSHSISMSTSSWAGPDANPTGPTDKFSGRLMAVRRAEYTGDTRFWLVASDGNTTQYFDPGTGVAAVADVNGNFPPIIDKRYSLRYEAAENGMVMTEPDGTKVIYGGSQVYSNMDMGNPYDITEIRKPNGFAIKIKNYTNGRPASVTTNTGIQLRYYYIPKSASVDPGAWWALNPEYVVGINNAVQYCPNSAGAQLNQADCSEASWPKVHYIWPNNMPNAMLTASNTFSVVDPAGAQTDYHQTSYHLDPNHSAIPDFTRITSVKPASASEVTLNYRYINRDVLEGIFGIAGYYSPQEGGVLAESWNGTDRTSYTPPDKTVQGVYMSATGYQGISAYTNAGTGVYGGKPVRIDAWNYSATFNLDGTLKTYADKLQQVGNEYFYDGRLNVVKIISRGVTQEAEYAASCTASNYKYCNSPIWVSDAKGNKTWFTYHASSGQVASITYPADKNNKIAQTRYEYSQLSALYFQDASGTKKSGTPIWMKTAEKHCANSNFVNNSCAGNDEVVVRFEYDNDNLFMTGKTVYSQKDNKTLRTCYGYDKYGNRIGETQPNANLASCY